jgi:hypothetical protein
LFSVGFSFRCGIGKKSNPRGEHHGAFAVLCGPTHHSTVSEGRNANQPSQLEGVNSADLDQLA